MDYPQALIDTAALQHNLNIVRKKAPHSKVIGIIKADGYGHGIVEVAKSLIKGVDSFGVARLQEGIHLRQDGIHCPIILLSGISNKADLEHAATHNLNLVIHHITQLELLQQVVLPNPISVWVKVDTGMHRLGFPPQQIHEVITLLRNCSSVLSIIGLMSHFANADKFSDSFTLTQLEIFNHLKINLPRSFANSAAIMIYPQSQLDWVRPGLMLYGISPFKDSTGSELNLKSVMTLKSRLIAIQHLHTGDKVGYDSTWICPKSMPVGIVALGYGDGYPRHIQNETPMLVNGAFVPIIGRISMDMITLDLRTQPNATVGDPVIAWGAGLPIERIAHRAGTIPYELVCQVTPRVPRVLL
ncbi:alanine racemase [Candidatus Nitrosacidococcus tergens]|uniref:Alanine racemase n=1 Tax=Candidatus Nitrosacidococcus tergens TaxID=553981 RepID=A0A7G1Q7K4_9GAMM|nr:alanine racemase [Candidatus Nitrosacidococcus tergens]CAB1274419.1 alanine racemase 1, PLP-binding, biosynthetic [Candidatus Nitrosacidococcus tergens]